MFYIKSNEKNGGKTLQNNVHTFTLLYWYFHLSKGSEYLLYIRHPNNIFECTSLLSDIFLNATSFPLSCNCLVVGVVAGLLFHGCPAGGAAEPE